MEVSRYRPLSIAWASLLAGLLCLAVALALDRSSWVRTLAEYAFASGVACVADRFVPRTWLFTKLQEAQPLPIGAHDVSDASHDVLLLGAYFSIVYLGVGSAGELLFHDSAAAILAPLAGAAIGLAVGGLRDSRMLERWEAGNGRVFTEGRPVFRRNGGLFVEDPAAAPLDAS